MRKLIIFCLTIAITISSANAQSNEIARITVKAGKFDRINTFVHTPLDGIDLELGDGEFVLYDITNGIEEKVTCQLDMQSGAELWWKLKHEIPAGKFAAFSLRLESGTKKSSDSKVLVKESDGNLLVKNGDKNVLQYNLKEAPLPKGVSEMYNRAGYIHPLWSPKGEILTRIQPPDHYHHLGLWNPWTHTRYNGKVIDFWNLIKGEGTVKPAGIISITSNDLFGGFQVLHNHIDLNGMTPTGAAVAMREVMDVRVWNNQENGWLVDFTSNMNCATDSLFKIIAYRYQGFGFRATEKWDDTTATLLTSEGKNKEDGNATRARWCDINGVSEFGTSGILFITHPSNYNYPEPIRIWPTMSNNGKENVFFNFNPAMDRDWILEPGNVYQLRYRMFIYDGKIDKNQAERLWADFAYPPRVSIEIVDK
jgi:hypothetical protein